jgi:hypothetical protein
VGRENKVRFQNLKSSFSGKVSCLYQKSQFKVKLHQGKSAGKTVFTVENEGFCLRLLEAPFLKLNWNFPVLF